MSKIVNIFGRMRQGKSTLSHYFANQAHAGVLIFDPNRQFSIGSLVYSREQLVTSLAEQESPVIYRPTLDIEEHFEQFGSVILDLQEGGISIVVDEASRLQSPNWIHPYLDAVIRASGSMGIDLFLTQHRMVDANGVVLELSAEYVFFQTKHPLSLARIADFTSEEVPDRVKALKRFEYLSWSVPEESFYVNSDSGSWHVPISMPAPEQEDTWTGKALES